MKPQQIQTSKLSPQAEIDLMRLAYRKRQEAYDYNLKDMMREAIPYLITGTVIAGFIAFIVAAFITV
jgi:uncharacterized membrane protein YraQ (UPF0718 family)